jgi:phage FluMu protein gp41
MEAFGGPPSKLKRLLCGRWFAAEMEMERLVSVRLGKHLLAASLHHLIRRRLEIVDGEDVETARKAAEGLTLTYSGPVKTKTAKELLMEAQVQQKVNFLKQLAEAGAIDGSVLLKKRETGKYGFEEAIERAENS